MLDVDRAITRLAGLSGAGVNAARQALLVDVFGRATDAEQQMLWRIFGGELRQGALDGVMVDAVARAAAVPVTAVRRAHMMSGDLGLTARARRWPVASARCRRSGSCRATPSSRCWPRRPPTSASAIAASGLSSVEWKLDGARIQAHRRDGAVRLFTRNLNEVTDRLGSVVALVEGLPAATSCSTARSSASTTRARPGASRTRSETSPPRPCTVAGPGCGRSSSTSSMPAGTSVVDEPLAVRREVLTTVVPELARLPSIVTADAAEASAFLDRAVAAGHEGVMVKALDAPYDAGRRGGAWRKVKPVHTLDLVVLAAEWGHGRRTGWLSNLHLGARGDDGGS